MGYHPEFDRCWPNGTSIHMKIRRKNWPFASHLWKSLVEVVRTDTDRSGAYDFLLTVHSNRGLILYRFQDILYLKLLKKIPESPRWRGATWNCVTALGFKKPRMLGLPSREKVWWCLQLFGYNIRQWQRDGQTDTGRRLVPHLHIVLRGKNCPTISSGAYVRACDQRLLQNY